MSSGPVKTCRQIVAYSVLLVPASLGPLLIPGVGLLYGAVALAADAGFLWRALGLYRLREGDESARRKAAMGLFGFSILYLFILFAAMLAEVILRARFKLTGGFKSAPRKVEAGFSRKSARNQRSRERSAMRPNRQALRSLEPAAARRPTISTCQTLTQI